MSNLNLLVVLNSYSDSRSSNAPNLVNFKWSRSIPCITAENLLSQGLVVAAGATVTLFTGSDAKKFLYLESDQALTMLINGTLNEAISPFVTSSGNAPGLFMRTSDITSLVVTNPGTTDANVFFAVAE